MTPTQRMLKALSDDYAADRIGLAEFERRVDRVFHDDPEPVDALRDQEAARQAYMIEAYKRGCMVFGA